MNYAVALSPILVFLALLLLPRFRVQHVAILSFVYTALLASSRWSVSVAQLGAAFGKGFFLTLDILLIVFGAIAFLNYLKQVGVIVRLEALLGSLSPDRRVQSVLLAWLFGGFVEGTSGFGTPALVVAPLLVGIGFPSLLAVVVCLIANSTAVAFGAVGTPLRIGFAGLEIAQVAEKAALINLISGSLVPLLIVAFVVMFGPSKQRAKAFFECVPWAIFSALAFLVPYYAISFIGFEFPSIVGAAVGLALAIVSIRLNFLVPRSTFRFTADAPKLATPPSPISLAPLGPYLLLLAVLIAGKLLLSQVKVSVALSGNLSHSFPLFNPGFAFLTTILLLNVIKRLPSKELVRIGAASLGPIKTTAASVCFVAAMTYTMALTSFGNTQGMLQVIAQPLANQALPFFSVFIGAFGSFLAGSATVSNILFAPIQAQAAEQLGYPVPWILALQLVGAGVGNMIALPNLLAVEASVGMSNQETALLRRLALPCLLYLALSGLVGQLLCS